ncbi:proteinase IV [Sorangium cellulosum]|jgi:serpin B|uniref:Proteinase IV n=1 Tax=Sorangium cellulosum TaxID=56 RepID=A0A4P2PVL3_SORCE|nr:serpin family protein [Sorangium cellulosum]AUX20739.1 proteinase IV [Sorangium cellulosum]
MGIHPISAFLLPLSLVLAGCVSDSTDPEPQPSPPECRDPDTAGCVVASEKTRILEPSVPDADRKELADGNTTFALELYRRLGAEPGNLFCSPHSVSSALAMTYAGARGETAAQMAGALRFTLPGERLHPAFNALDLALAGRGKGAEGRDGGGFRLHVANAIWGQVGYSFQPSFLDVLAQSYGAGLRVVDFVEAPEAARGIINAWVARRTEDRIRDILPEGAIGPSTRLVLTNAIYFNAAWQFPFKEEQTTPGDFTLAGGSTVSVPMMAGVAQLRYGEGDGYQALEMPYEGGELSMLLVLPSALGELEAGLDRARLDGILDSLGERSVAITLPRFKVESTFDLVPPLSELGMPIAFRGDADFSGISGQGGLSITDVIHKAFVSVDEAGTEAAAATAVVIGETAAPEPATIRFDRPFLFFIRDHATGAILFVGRVANPSA